MMDDVGVPRRANIIFHYSAWIVVALGIFMILLVTPWIQHFSHIEPAGTVLRVLGGVLGVIGAPASLILWFGMVAHCAFKDRSPLTHKLAWFAALFIAAMFGAAAYYFAKYVKQAQKDPVSAT